MKGIPLPFQSVVFVLMLFCTCVSPGLAQAIITTYAGGPLQLSGLLTITQIGIGPPNSVIADGSGGFYFSSLQRTYRVVADGSLMLIAGNGSAGFSGDGGPAISAQLDYPSSIALDRDGNLFIADTHNNRIRKVTPDGVISTVAGTGFPGFSGDGGSATSAQLFYPSGIAVDGGGNLFIMDSVNYRIRKVDSRGIITTLAGNGTAGFSGDSGPATFAQLSANDISVNVDDSLIIADLGNNRIRKVDSRGIITTLAGDGTAGFSGDGGPATSAQLHSPGRITVDARGNLFIADLGNNRIRKVTPAGIITTVAGNGTVGSSGDGGPATSAELASQSGISTDAEGNLFIADDRRIRKVTTTGTIITVAGNGAFAGDGRPSKFSTLVQPSGVFVNKDGTLLIADFFRIAKVNAAGVMSTWASTGLDYPSTVAADVVGNVFTTDLGYGITRIDAAGIISNVGGDHDWYFFDYDGAFAPVGEVCIEGIAVDAQGNLFVAQTFSQSIWKITPAGIVTRVVGSVNETYGFSGDGGPAISATLSFPNGITVDGDGDLFIADSYNNRIRKVTPAGIISTVAGNGTAGFGGDGGPATSAQLWYPLGVSVDKDGNLFIADSHNSRIRKVDTAGIITTVAGNGTFGFSGDGGPPNLAQLDYPTSVAVDESGNLFIADYRNIRIREVSLPPLMPALFAISAEVGFQGTSVNVTLTGANFTAGITIDAIPGVTISNVQVVNSNTISAVFSIDPSASPGSRSVTVTGPGGTSVAVPFTVNAFTVPSVAGIRPVSGVTGESVAVTLTGSSFMSGMTIDPGAGIRVSNISVVNPTLASANFAIDSDAIVGGRLITVSTNLGISNAVAFSVTPPQLTVLKFGTGSGMVTSSPAGILCGGMCSTTFTPGQVFTLSAIPAAGTVFAGWGGDADCLDGSVTMTGSRNCTARFDIPRSDSTLLRGDYDGDGKSDFAVYRPSTGEWYLRLSTQGYAIAAGNWYFQWGVAGDVPIAGDFDGDGKTDIAVYRPSTGEWYLRLSTQGYAIAAGNWYFQWGVAGDVPITGDFDGDGKTDITVYRPSTGEWYTRLSTLGYAVAQGNWYFQWGVPGDQPEAGDFDGDGKTDIAVYRPSTGEWYIRLSTRNYAIAVGNWYVQWGIPGDQPVAGDYDGDGKTDIAVYRPGTGEWFLRLSTQNYAVAVGNWYFQWGLPGDQTIKGDFDGDGKADIAVFRPSTGEWFFRLSTQGYSYFAGNWYFQWGVAGDLPVRR